jgi:3-deoxy-7-phosphoheptulonate synthase
MGNKIYNTHIDNAQVLITPQQLKTKLPLTSTAQKTVLQYRKEIENILDGKDNRKFIVVGPCSIHDLKAAEEYSHRLKKLADQVKDKFLLIMRVYFEKPRTTVGWKGLINDPDMDDSFHLEKGLNVARKLLLDLAELGLPAGTEALDPIIPQYIGDLIAWSAIGARTTESQTHREMASGLSMPVGFKNGTDGGIQVALNALHSAKTPHHFVGINQNGQVSVFRTKGNSHGHIILRGGDKGTNYHEEAIKLVEEKLLQADLLSRIVIDCSHGNSNKDHRQQGKVFDHVMEQILAGNTSIMGMMLESNIHEGSQSIPANLEELKYGVSVTDKCICWEDTERLILGGYEKLTNAKQLAVSGAY